MAKYSTISVPRELHDELQQKIKNDPQLGYSSIAEFCKEAIRVHLSNIRLERREAYLQRINVTNLLRKVEAASTISSDECRIILESCMDPIFVMKPNGILTNVNHELVDKLGYNNKDDFLDKDVTMLFTDGHAFSKMMTAAQPDGVSNYEIQIVRRDGKLLDFLISITPTKKEDGKILRYCGFAKDITVRKLAESRLKREHELFNMILKDIYDMIIVLQNNKVKFASGHLQASGYTADELIDMKLSALLPEPDVKKAKRMAQRRLAGEEVPPLTTYRLKCKKGGLITIEVSSQVIMYEDHEAFLCVIRTPKESCDG
jgi:PAS domain S-box-containing protein